MKNRGNFFTWIAGKHELIYKAGLVISGILLVLYFLPLESKFKFEYYKGKPWLHESLIAPFDFAVSKLPDELENEKEEVIKNSIRWFRVDPEILKTETAEFLRDLDTRWAAMEKLPGKKTQAEKEKVAFKGIALLKTLYQKGVVLLPDEMETGSSEVAVMVLREEIAEETEIRNLFTIQSAYEYIQKELGSGREASSDILLSLLEDAIAHNVRYDALTTEKMLADQMENISDTRGKKSAGERIILKGDIVDDETFRVLESLRSEYETRYGSSSGNYAVILGNFLLASLPFLVLMIFLFLFRKDIFADNHRISLLLFMIVLMVFIFTTVRKSELVSLYMVPFCIVPVIIRTFYDTRLALFTHLVVVLITGFIAPNGFEFAFMQIISGMAAIFSIVNMRNRSQLFIAAGVVLAVYLISFTGISLVHEESFSEVRWDTVKWFAGNALLTLFAYPMIYAVEKIFGFTSDVSLMEIADSNSPLLRELAFRAPGTFQHSLQVANLAEAAIYEIGGNTLLVRAGALYHDAGKLDMPLYFIENQSGGTNPHDEISYEDSAGIIISHVIKGVELAKKNKLPDPVIDFIRTHHGTTRVQYFYQSSLRETPEQLPDDAIFRYPGPIPFSKETAVLMMADAVEAASKSLKTYNQAAISTLVESIIDSQIQQEQFINSDITFRDIRVIKKIFKKMLMSIYHVRVEYPG